MRPLTVVSGILLGTSVSITASLAAVVIISLVLGDEYPRLAYEFGGLARSTLAFALLTAISAASFYSMLKQHRYRYLYQAGMWLTVVAIGAYYWP